MIKLYGLRMSNYYSLTKAVLIEKGLEFEEINIDHNPEARAFLKAGGHKTCPQIYYRSNILVEGGCNGLLALSKEQIESIHFCSLPSPKPARIREHRKKLINCLSALIFQAKKKE